MQASGGQGVTVKAKEDPCGVCGKRVKQNLMQCTTCLKWVQAKCAKVKVTNRLVRNFVCTKRLAGEPGNNDGQFLEGIEKVQKLCYLGNVLNDGGGCEIAVLRRSLTKCLVFYVEEGSPGS